MSAHSPVFRARTTTPPGLGGAPRPLRAHLAIVLALGLGACGDPDTATAGGSGSGGEHVDGEHELTSAVELHEWALLDVTSSGATELGAGPGHPPPTVSVRKPVIYAHLRSDLSRAVFSLEARVVGGALLERWPPGTAGPASVSWNVSARAEHCSTAVSEGSRSARMPADGVSELPDLASYDAPSSACLVADGISSGLLFYRGTVGTPNLPLAIARSAGGVAITASGETAETAGELVRITRTPSGLVVARAPVPARGESVELADGAEPLDAAREGARLREAMLAQGLWGDEADAFLAAWSEPLFGAPAARGPVRDAREPAPPAPAPLDDVVLYWLAPRAIDAIATLGVRPATTVVHRAFLVRVELSPAP